MKTKKTFLFQNTKCTPLSLSFSLKFLLSLLARFSLGGIWESLWRAAHLQRFSASYENLNSCCIIWMNDPKALQRDIGDAWCPRPAVCSKDVGSREACSQEAKRNHLAQEPSPLYTLHYVPVRVRAALSAAGICSHVRKTVSWSVCDKGLVWAVGPWYSPKPPSVTSIAWGTFCWV